MDNEQPKPLDKDYLVQETEKSIQSNNNSTLTTDLNKNCSNNETLSTDNIESNIDKEENEDKNSIDSFILQNFILFFGEQDVSIWLHETEKKFNRLFILRNLRFTAIPLLVEGHAKRIYTKNRRSIRYFDDFYEILLSHFDENDAQSTVKNPQGTILLQSCSLHQTKSSDKKSLPTMTTLDNIHFSGKPPKHHSRHLNEFSAAGISGESPASQSILPHNNSTSHNDGSHANDTTNVLPKVLLQNLVQNPKTFQGGKNDVIK